MCNLLYVTGRIQGRRHEYKVGGSMHWKLNTRWGGVNEGGGSMQLDGCA